MSSEQKTKEEPSPVLPGPAPAADARRAAELTHELRRFHFDPPSPKTAVAADWRPALLHGGGLPEPAGTPSDPEPDEPGRAPFQLLAQVARSRRQPSLAAFHDDVRVLQARCEELLEADRQKRPESRQARSVEGAMGSLGARLIDASALTGVLDRQRRGTPLTEERLESLRGACATLGLLADAPRPELVLVHEDHPDLHDLHELRDFDGWQVAAGDDPCAAAAELFDAGAERLAHLLRAVRRIRLEADGRYRPELHDPWLEQLDWRSFTAEELLLLPPVAAVVRADQVARRGMVSLSRLLLSGRPVQVFMLARPFANPGQDDGAASSGFRFEPAYLGLSHREALVQQTSTARPTHMTEGFRRALGTGRAALHVILSAPADASAPEIAGRAHPLFHYDPDAGWSWADRLDFSGNPQPDADWPVYELGARREGGGDETLSLPFTFADLALLEPSYGRHFAPVPDGVPDDVLVDMSAYCDLPPEDASHRVPYVWGVDARSRLRRLAVSRPLALACRDRLGFWRTLQELAGIRSEHVRRAALAAREQAEEQARQEIRSLEERHQAELERLRHDVTRDVVDRLTASLLEVDVAALPPLPPLARFQGRGVDDVSAALLALVDPAKLDEAVTPGDGQVEQVAAELERLLGEATV